MKKILLLFTLCLIFGHIAQAQTGKKSPEKTIRLFFEAFHERDTAAMRSLSYGNLSIRSIKKDKAGSFRIQTEDFDDFLKSIASIPENVKIREKIDRYETEINGAMAHVWTPYSFYVNGQLIHCGANSFQLFKKENEWKIISIMDTRQKEGCVE